VSPGRTRGGKIPVDSIIDWLIHFVSAENRAAGLAILCGSAALEYIFPPFPGDTITLFGAVLITAHDWSFSAVFGAVMIGSVVGAMIDFALGQRWRRHRERTAKPDSERQASRRATLDRLTENFRRHGAAYLIINRFFPGIRALFFVAAGLAGMRPLPVLVYSAISAALWNLGVIALGSLLGANFDTLVELYRQYALISWIIITSVALLFLARTIWRRRRKGP
jgi:membrane protein DedA with SNARE-associated domain